MCRILFQIRNEERPDGIKFMNILDLMENGGPDDQGVLIKKVDKGRFAYFGHRRLSILDLSKDGHQPMTNEDGSIVLLFNGEIYNYEALKITYGIKTKSTGDTEVILKLYELLGEKMFDVLDGEFAIVIYDFNTEDLYFATDLLGIKPLYFYSNSVEYIISSELKSLIPLLPENRKRFSKPSLSDSMMTGYSGILPIDSISKSVPGIIHHYKRKGGYTSRFLRSSQGASNSFMSAILSETLPKYITPEEIRNTLELAVKKRMIGDVPISLTLSGGIDSSILAYLMAKNSSVPIRTYSIAFEGQPNEFKNARIVSDFIKSDHTEIIISKQDIINNFDDILMTMEAPFDRGSLIPTYFLAKAIKEKVTLIGEGADEVFGGYSRYTKYFEGLSGVLSNPENGNRRFTVESEYVERYIDQFPRNINVRRDYHFIYPSPKTYLEGRENRLYLEDGPLAGGEHGTLKGLQYWDLINEVALYHNTRIDKMMMRFGVEARVPFLDPEVVEIGLSIGSDQKLNPPKKVLRDAFRGLLPDSILDQEKKPLKYPYEEIIDAPAFEYDLTYALENKILDPQLLKTINALPDGTRNKTRMIWSMILVSRFIRLMQAKGIIL